jgi:hypothetical protein
MRCEQADDRDFAERRADGGDAETRQEFTPIISHFAPSLGAFLTRQRR